MFHARRPVPLFSLVLTVAMLMSWPSSAAEDRKVVRKASPLDLKKLEKDAAGKTFAAGETVLVISNLGDKEAVIKGLAKYGVAIKAAEPLLMHINNPRVKALVIGVTAATGAIVFIHTYASDDFDNWLWVYRWWIALVAGICAAVSFVAYRLWKKWHQPMILGREKDCTPATQRTRESPDSDGVQPSL
jgi:hypothetical protein